MHARQRQSGFTLIEIAIVLVIIGLLLGGILKGQELITSARVRNLADQGNGIQAAYYGFVDRYRNLPGDWVPAAAQQAFGLAVLPTGGDGNGQIDVDDFSEPLAVWQHLSASGFIGSTYVGGNAAPNADNQAPRNAFSGFVTLAHSDDYQVAAATTATVRLNLAIGRRVPVAVVRELDVKIDDGRPLEGTFRAALATGAGLTPTVEGEAACVNTANWDVAGDSQDCNGIILY